MPDYVEADRAREIVRDAYKSPKWKKKVDQMSDRQVYAIFFSICERGEKKRKERVSKLSENVKSIREHHPELIDPDIAYEKVRPQKINISPNMSMMKVIYQDSLYDVYAITNDSYIVYIDGDYECAPKELCEVV